MCVLFLHETKVAICDESHNLKNGMSQRYKLLSPALKACKHLLLLSGTPALARPVELYPQVNNPWGTLVA